MWNRNIETFLGCDGTYEDSHIVIFGAPFDSTTSYRPGTRFAARTMRAESYGLEMYSPYQDLDLEDAHAFDGGDLELPFGDTERALAMIHTFSRNILMDGRLPLLIGWSRKSSLGAALAAPGQQPPPPQERISASVAAALLAVERGAAIVRVHDVAETAQALKVWAALQPVR